MIADDEPGRLRELPARHGLGSEVTFRHDPGSEVGARYEVMYTPEHRGGHAEPAVLVLNPDGTVYAASYTVSSVGRMSVDEALRAVRRIRGEG